MAVLFAWGDSSCWQDLVQMVGRPRHLVKRLILSWVQEKGKAPWLDETTYRKALLEARTATYGLMKEYLDADGTIVRAAMDDEHLSSHVRTVTHECRSRHRLAATWWSYWKSQGCEILDATVESQVPRGVLPEEDRKAMRKERSADKQQLRLERAEAIAAAEVRSLSVSKARAILERDHTPMEGNRATKVLIEDFYNRPATVPLIWDDKDGKLRQQVRAFNSVRMLATYGKEGIQRLLKAKDEREVQSGVTATMRHHTAAAILRWEALQAAGVTVEALRAIPTTLDPVHLDAWVEYTKNPTVQRLFKQVLGISIRSYLEPKSHHATGSSLIITPATVL